MTLQGELEEFEHWLTHKSRPVRESSVIAYRKKLAHLVQFCEDQGIDTFSPDKLTAAKVKQFKDTLLDRAKNGARDTRELVIATRILLKWAEGNPDEAEHADFKTRRTEALRYNGMDMARRAARLERIPMITPKEAETLMQIASDTGWKKHSARTAALIALMYSSGARVDEAVNVRVKDVARDTTEKCWKVYFPKSKHVAHSRVGFLTQFSGDRILLEWVEARKKTAKTSDEPLFLTASNERFTTSDFRALWKRLRREAIKTGGELGEKMQLCQDLRLAGHMLRHGRAKFLARAKGWNFSQVQSWLGDKKTSMVSVYCTPGGVPEKLAQERGDKVESLYDEPESRCPHCKTFTMPGDNFCAACGQALNPEIAKRLDKGMDTIQELVKAEVQRQLSEAKKG